MTANLDMDYVVPDACRYNLLHPSWCNKEHQAGANPRRQHHLSTWHSTHGKTLPVKIEFYPCGGRPGTVNAEPASFFTVYGAGRMEVISVLKLRDLRSLAQHITEIADAAEAEAAAVADANGLEQWW